MENLKLGIFSGECLQGICGEETQLVDALNQKLSVGDLVIAKYYEAFNGNTHSDYLTVVCNNNYKSYSNGQIFKKALPTQGFVMGIADTSITGEGMAKEDKNGELCSGWTFTKVKGWEDAIEGELWKGFGFNYKMVSVNDILDDGQDEIAESVLLER